MIERIGMIKHVGLAGLTLPLLAAGSARATGAVRGYSPH